MQKIVVCFSSTAASVIVTPNSMVRMIVSATTDGEQAVASGTGSLGVVVVAGVGTRIVTRRGPTSAHRHDNIPGNPPITDALSFTKSPKTSYLTRSVWINPW
ncbi:hypothetical protein IWGMT90018_39510 [Mycobacterium kiyosense]|nr:hypothetical protein IWGMT90018_39510 [Mycobacterium kiyosense]